MSLDTRRQTPMKNWLFSLNEWTVNDFKIQTKNRCVRKSEQRPTLFAMDGNELERMSRKRSPLFYTQYLFECFIVVEKNCRSQFVAFYGFYGAKLVKRSINVNHRVFEWASSGVSADCFSQYGIAYLNIKYECDFRTLSTSNNSPSICMNFWLIRSFIYRQQLQIVWWHWRIL